MAAGALVALASNAETAGEDSQWTDMGGLPGPDGEIHSMVVDRSGNVYVGGDFSAIGNVKANKIAKWDGSSWSPLGSGIDGRLVLSLAVSGTDLYAGGWFNTAGGKPANNVAKWDGKAWSPLGDGVDDLVFTVAVSGRNVYVGGVFTMAGGKAMESIAQWDGSSWSALGSGLDNWVVSLFVSGTDLYAGGSFTVAGGIEANHIAKWDGTTWSSLGSGMNGDVLAYAVRGSDLYVGGEFTKAGGNDANRIAKWDGSKWSSLGSGTDHWVWALEQSGTDLYAGGTFTNAGGAVVNHVAKWDGKTWSALGSGVTGGEKTKVGALAVSGTNLYAGGNFNLAGGKVSTNIARLRLQAAAPLALAPLAIIHNRTRPEQPFTLSWPAKVGRRYQIHTATDLDQPWTPLLPTPRIASATLESFELSGPTRARAFFRILELDADPVAPPGMALIPAGQFQMGDTFNEGDTDERPVHTVQVSAFFMDQFEVTQELWDVVNGWAANNGYGFDSGGNSKGPDHPVHSIMWFDAVKWCNARSEMEGRVPAYYTSADQTEVYRAGQVNVQNDWVKWNAGYRLPTEAEWEKAARGGFAGRRFPWGNTISHGQANYSSFARRWYNYDLNPLTAEYHPSYNTDGRPYTNPVNAFPPNGYGLHDMAGNVSEWCWDWYGPPLVSSTYYRSSPSNDPRGPASGSWRVDRGGNWDFHAYHLRSAERFANLPTHTPNFLGFRTVLPAAQP